MEFASPDRQIEVPMYVCVCHAVTDEDIRKAVDRGACSLLDVQNQLPVASCCGRCEETARGVVDEYLSTLGEPTEIRTKAAA